MNLAIGNFHQSSLQFQADFSSANCLLNYSLLDTTVENCLYYFTQVYVLQDAFFTNINEAQTKLHLYFGLQGGLVFGLIIVCLILNYRSKLVQSIIYTQIILCQILQSNSINIRENPTSFKVLIKLVFVKARVLISQIIQTAISMISFALLHAAYYLQTLKWPHICNQFNFTQSDSDLMSTYFQIGSLLSLLITSQKYLKFDSPKSTLLAPYLGLMLSLGAMIATLKLGILWLSTIIAFTLGTFLFTLILKSIDIILKRKSDKKEIDFYNLAVALTLAGACSAIVTGFGDKVHYMNRDVTDWIYASEGFIALFVTTSLILMAWSSKL